MDIQKCIICNYYNKELGYYCSECLKSRFYVQGNVNVTKFEEYPSIEYIEFIKKKILEIMEVKVHIL